MVDASVVVAGLVDGGGHGRWAESVLVGNALAAPHLMLVEVANILRRAAVAGRISDEDARLAHADLLALRVELFSYESVAQRAWELRSTVTIYDSSYVALAEGLDVPLATLDQRLVRAPGPRCRFATPQNA